MAASQFEAGMIPIVFPQFGKADPAHPYAALPQHGFARNSWWKLKSIERQESCAVATLILNSEDLSEAYRTVFPFAFQLQVQHRLDATSLTTTLTVMNTDSTRSFEFQTLLHTYHRVGNVSDIRITSLNGYKYLDKVSGGVERIESEEDMVIRQEVDRVYMNSPSQLTLHGKSMCRIVKSSGFPDVVVWNPWIDKARAMSDFADTGYLEMVCIEPGHVAGYAMLEPGQAWTASQTIVAAGGSEDKCRI